jgi:hypothetical protein
MATGDMSSLWTRCAKKTSLVARKSSVLKVMLKVGVTSTMNNLYNFPYSI